MSYNKHDTSTKTGIIHFTKYEGKVKVLIIDDEADICFLLTALLKQKNVDAEYVNTLSEAEVALLEQNPEVIFLDNYLPDGLGLNFIGFIKRHNPKTKVIMITAHDTEGDRQKALNQGADFFICKPFSKDIIFNTMEKASA